MPLEPGGPWEKLNGVFSIAGVFGPLAMNWAGPPFVGIVMYDWSVCPLKPALTGEKGEFIGIPPACALPGWPWLVSTRGVIASPLGTFLWKEDDLRFLLGPALPALVGDPGLDRLVGVIVADVVAELKPEFCS